MTQFLRFAGIDAEPDNATMTISARRDASTVRMTYNGRIPASEFEKDLMVEYYGCLLYTSPSPRD